MNKNKSKNHNHKIELRENLNKQLQVSQTNG